MNLKPSEIVDKINSFPPLQRKNQADGYINQPVEWDVTFHTGHGDDDMVHLMLRNQGNYPWIYADASLTEYPQFKVMQEGHRLIVKGKIKSIEGNTISLKNTIFNLGSERIIEEESVPVDGQGSSRPKEKINWTKWGTILAAVSLALGFVYYRWPYNVGSEILNVDANDLPLSLYVLAENMYGFSGTSVEREDIFKKYIGMQTSGEGFVNNVSRISNDLVLVSINKELGNYLSVSCIFESDWTKAALALSKNQKVAFSGIVDRYSLGINMRDCKLK